MTDPAAPDPVTADAADGSGPDQSRAAGIGQSNIPQETGAQVPPLPYFVAVDGDERAGIVHYDLIGQWHAANWAGTIGVYPDEGLAVAAVIAAPNRPRTPKASRPLKAEPPKLIEGDTAGRVYRDKRQIGGWIRTADGYAAWTRAGKAGVFETPGLAANAAIAAFLESQAEKARAKAALRKGALFTANS
jgi:hypothetical protein